MPNHRSEIRDVRFTRSKGDGKQVNLPAKCAAYAENAKGGEMLVAMVAAPVMVAKGIAAMMRGDNNFAIHVPDLGVGKRFEGDYRVAISRLPGFAMAQVLIVADMPSLLIGPIEDALWRYLMSDRISTPLLRQWLPQIHDQLESYSKIIATNGFGCEVHVANFDTEMVDLIVSALLKRKKVWL